MASGVMPFLSSSLHLAAAFSSGGCSLEMLSGVFCPWWMGRSWCGSEDASSNKLDLPFKKSDLEQSVCVLATMEVGSALGGDGFFDWRVLEESGGVSVQLRHCSSSQFVLMELLLGVHHRRHPCRRFCRPKGGHSLPRCWQRLVSTRALSTFGYGGPVTSPWLAPAAVTQVVSSPVLP